VVLELKREYDGLPATTSLSEWYVQYLLLPEDQPKHHQPLANYTYAEDVPKNEVVP